MYCTNCGKEIAEGSKFCNECGAKVITVDNDVQLEKDTVEEKNVVEEKTTEEKTVEEVHPAVEAKPTEEVQSADETKSTVEVKVAVEDKPAEVEKSAPTEKVAEPKKDTETKTNLVPIIIISALVGCIVFVCIILFVVLFKRNTTHEVVNESVFSEDVAADDNVYVGESSKAKADDEDSSATAVENSSVADNANSASKTSAGDSAASNSSIKKSEEDALQNFFDTMGYSPYGYDYSYEYGEGDYWDEYDVSEYILPESDMYLISEDDLYGFDEYDCKLARNEIYARYGRRFDSPDIQEYFDNCSWYTGTIDAKDFDQSILSDIEIKNLDIIIKYEKEQGFR